MSLPVVTVAVIAFALFVVGAPRPYFGARVYGGTTEGVSTLSLRIAVVERFVEVEEPAALGTITVCARTASKSTEREVTLDEGGMAAVTLDLGGEPGKAEIEVSAPGAGRPLRLALGQAELSTTEWRARERLRGGWLKGSLKGNANIRVAPARGAFAVPFTDPLWIDVNSESGPVVGATLDIDADGFEVVGERGPWTTNAAGRVSVSIAPRDHVAWLRVTAKNASGVDAEWSGPIPVAAGALHASREGSKLRIESAIERDVAYWAIEGDASRIAGGPVKLQATGRGGAVALIDLPELAARPLWGVVSGEPELWGVVSGEPELDSASTVGWPLSTRADPLAVDPPLARSVPDWLLVDGLMLGFRADAERRQKARHLALGFTALASLLALVLLVREGRRSAADLDRHLRNAGASDADADVIAQKKTRWLSVVVALLCVAMGFLVVLLVALHRIG